jgi:IPT/TIG domain-containing protein/uncharacterized protein DUF6531
MAPRPDRLTSSPKPAGSGCATVLILLCCACLCSAAPTISRIAPFSGQPGDQVTITGAGFNPDPTQIDLRFGPNRAPVLSSTGTTLTARVPNGQPLGPTQVTVDSSNARSFITIARSKIVAPPNPAAQCEGCGCDPCCQPPNSSPCVSKSAHLGATLGGKSGNIYGERGEFYQHVTDLVIPGRTGAADTVHYTLTREYRSAADNQGPLGNKWDHIYFEKLELEPDGSIMDHDGLGRNNRYLLNNVGEFVAPPEF